MPTPDRTSLEQIVAAARQILESDGLAGLTMQAVAERVGVRAPSLYKRVRSREALIGLVAEATILDLGARVSAINSSPDPRKDLAALARVFRAFAHDRPTGYRLIFGWNSETARPGRDSFDSAVGPLLRITAELVGPDDALSAARTFTAWANGFLSMELAGAFQLGGSVEDAFEYGIARLADAFTKPERA
jgi:AcrR family transcriptional regulator